MATTVRDVLLRADYLLKQKEQNESIRRWTRAELYLWVADAVAALYKADPSIGAVTASFQLVEGTKQNAPSTWDVITDVVRNKPNNGAYGDAVRMVDRYTLDSVDPDWHAQDPSSIIDEWCVGDGKREFYVNPPASTAAWIEARGVLAPPKFTNEAASITVPDFHVETLANYVVHRALSKDAEEGLAPIATAFFNQFKAGLPGG
jgi:hypothetical protein